MEPLLFEETVRHFSPASLRTILREILCQGKNPTEAYLDRAENFLKSNEQSERNEALGRIWNECYRLLLKTDVVKAMKESERRELRWLLCQVEAF